MFPALELEPLSILPNLSPPSSPMGGLVPIILPSSAPSSINVSPTTSFIISDERAIAGLIDKFISKAGLSQAEVARRMGIQPATLNAYLKGRRPNPSVKWMAKLAIVCGGRLVAEFPPRPIP